MTSLSMILFMTGGMLSALPVQLQVQDRGLKV